MTYEVRKCRWDPRGRFVPTPAAFTMTARTIDEVMGEVAAAIDHPTIQMKFSDSAAEVWTTRQGLKGPRVKFRIGFIGATYEDGYETTMRRVQ